MKKTYTNPQVKVVKINPSAIICESVGFGEGSTDVMHAKQYNAFQDEEDDE